MGQLGELEPSPAYTAVVHSLGLEHGTDVSERIPSCKPSGPFHEAVDTSEKNPVFLVWCGQGRADEDALLQQVEDRLSPAVYSILHLVQIFHYDLGLLVDHPDGVCQGWLIGPVEFLQELSVSFALQQGHAIKWVFLIPVLADFGIV